ncbi:hypothetical protein [Methanosarcina sp.]|uniref:hypothetical protein n=1 Tax=Methanosarcina sp. TaxID=2213 RepID=UPI0029880BEE|nr:hypothetical protein [Methanosarcina sp.]MDW5550321.1 hypothetical protein [Methanosarcina sp.]MDW5554149.1 hypothetical protein [Methanosarcina sp.]MDW5560345.1 hypothetical protein [Methanosarcina sp.]
MEKVEISSSHGLLKVGLSTFHTEELRNSLDWRNLVKGQIPELGPNSVLNISSSFQNLLEKSFEE